MMLWEERVGKKEGFPVFLLLLLLRLPPAPPPKARQGGHTERDSTTAKERERERPKTWRSSSTPLRTTRLPQAAIFWVPLSSFAPPASERGWRK